MKFSSRVVIKFTYKEFSQKFGGALYYPRSLGKYLETNSSK